MRRRLRELEERGTGMAKDGEGRGEELIPRESWEVIKKKSELDDVVKQKEKRLLRL